jgi:hypothetical protein
MPIEKERERGHAGEPVVDPEPRKEKTHEINHRFYKVDR